MKITDNSTAKQINFQDIEMGTVFEFAGSYFMKTEYVKDVMDFQCNAVDLINGCMVKFDSENLIHIVDAELTIK